MSNIMAQRARRIRDLIDENERLRNALATIIAHYDEQGARTTGMDMILKDCRKLLEI